MIRRHLALTTLAAALSLAGCGGDDKVIKIGHVAPLTGGIAHLGKDNEYGAQLAIEQANAAKIKIGGKEVQFQLVAEDDQGLVTSRVVVVRGDPGTAAADGSP